MDQDCRIGSECTFQLAGQWVWTPSTAASPSGSVLRDLGLASNQVWGLGKTDQGMVNVARGSLNCSWWPFPGRARGV